MKILKNKLREGGAQAPYFFRKFLLKITEFSQGNKKKT